MSTHPLYTSPTGSDWSVELAGDARFSWEYDAAGSAHQRLLGLYQKGKDKQWDQIHRIDWDSPLDPENALDLPIETIPIYGSKMFDPIASDPKRLGQLRQHLSAWQFSQFLHGEQGAMICAARIVESAPDLDSKLYAATQTMDEARHAETYARFLQEKIGMLYPINTHLQALLSDTLTDSRWDMPYLGMQVLIEGLALAAFGLLRDTTQVALPKQILAYVMADEARHVAFGRIALREYYAGLSTGELQEREEFVIEGCHLMQQRFRAEEVWEQLDLPVAECVRYVSNSEVNKSFQSLLFQRIVPCVKDIGLWGLGVQSAYEKMGVAGYVHENLDELMRIDEATAAGLDATRDNQEARREYETRAGRVEELERARREEDINAVAALGAAEVGVEL